MQRILCFLTEFFDCGLKPPHLLPARFHLLLHSLVLGFALRLTQIQPSEEEFILLSELGELLKEGLPIVSLDLQN